MWFLLSGSRSGAIHHHDVRVASHHVGSLLGHNQEVCGLEWSPDGKLLASGGNDNVLNIWAHGGAAQLDTNPLHILTHHQAAVKVCVSSLVCHKNFAKLCITEIKGKVWWFYCCDLARSLNYNHPTVYNNCYFDKVHNPLF